MYSDFLVKEFIIDKINTDNNKNKTEIYRMLLTITFRSSDDKTFLKASLCAYAFHGLFIISARPGSAVNGLNNIYLIFGELYTIKFLNIWTPKKLL